MLINDYNNESINCDNPCKKTMTLFHFFSLFSLTSSSAFRTLEAGNLKEDLEVISGWNDCTLEKHVTP